MSVKMVRHKYNIERKRKTKPGSTWLYQEEKGTMN